MILRLAMITLALLLGGCSAAAPPISPTAGVDELVIPTPSPTVADFSATVDNPWFPLAPGSRWSYRVLGDSDGDESGTTAEVVDGVEIGGVSTTGLRIVERQGGGAATETLDYYAQDEAGNVWWFGRDGEWRAGESGAQAGLFLAARSRRGDGYPRALAPGVIEPRAEVLLTEQEFTTTLATYDDVVVLETVDALDEADGATSYYAAGVGLIRSEGDRPAGETWELESFEPGR